MDRMGWFVSALEVARKLTILEQRLNSLEPDRRRMIVEYLEAVSSTLMEISAAIERKERVDFQLGKLHTYGAQIPYIFGGAVEEKEGLELANDLPNYWPPGNLLEIHNPGDEPMCIDMIGEYARCAGAFKALAETLSMKL